MPYDIYYTILHVVRGDSRFKFEVQMSNDNLLNIQWTLSIGQPLKRLLLFLVTFKSGLRN